MASIKCTIFFQSISGGVPTGWSESYYDMVSGDIAASQIRMAALCAQRSALLAPGVGIVYRRASDDDVRGDSRVGGGVPFSRGATGPAGAPVTPGPGSGYILPLPTTSSPGAVADFPYSVLLVRYESDALPLGLYRSMRPISGLPDDWQLIDLQYPNDPDFNRLWPQWVDYLTRNQWGFRVKDRTDTSNPPKQITEVVDGSPVTVTCTAHGFAPGSKVQITGVKSTIKVNGTYQIKVLDVNSFGLVGTNATGIDYIGGGQARLVKFKIVPIQHVVTRRFSKRNRGRPFDQLRGRARRKSRGTLIPVA